MPRSRISERAAFRIYEHAQCRVFERTSLQRVYVIPCRQQMVSSAVLRARRRALMLAATTGCRVNTCVMAIGADFKMCLLRQFCSNRVEFFLQYTGDTDAKNDGSEFLKFEFCDFRFFFEIFKKASPGPSSADLDHYGRGETRSE